MIDPTVLRLRQLEQLREQLAAVDRVTEQLSPAERMILRDLILQPEKNKPQRLCGLLGVEEKALYRRRRQVLEKFRRSLPPEQ